MSGRNSKYSSMTLEEVEAHRRKKYPDGVKICFKCKAPKLLVEFRVIKNNPSWLHSWCIGCCRSYSRSRKSPPGYEAARGRRRSRENRERSPEEVQEIQRRLYPSGMKTCRTCKIDISLNRYHKGAMQYDGLYSSCMDCANSKRTNRRYKVYEEYWNSRGIPAECYLCGGPYQEVEHVVPETLYGLDTPRNTRPVCSRCNHGSGGKHGTPMEVYIYLVDHPTKTRAEVLEGLMVDDAWPFSVEYGSKEWEDLAISKDPEFAHLFTK